MKNKILDFFNKPVLLEESYFQTLKNNLSLSISGIKEKKKIPNSFLSVQGSVAIIKIIGVITEKKEETDFTICPCSVLVSDIKKVMVNPDIKVVVFDFDTPGGEVAGVSNVADLIFDLGKEKRTIALVNSLAASAGYWMASACNEIALVSETAIVGSIGVVVSHVDISKALENQGILVTHVTAGRYKRITASEIPLTEEALKVLQDQVTEIYDIFVGKIAKYKGKSVEEILPVCDGRTYIGNSAISAGLANGFSNFRKLIGVESMEDFNIFMIQEDEEKKKMEEEEEEEAQDDEENDKKEAQEDKKKMGEDKEKAQEDDEEEDEEEAQDDEEKKKMQKDEDKKEAKITKSSVPHVRLGVKLERDRVKGLVALGLSGKDLVAAISSGKDEKSVAFEILTKRKNKKKSRNISSFEEGVLVQNSNSSSSFNSKKSQIDLDIEAAKLASERVRARL